MIKSLSINNYALISALEIEPSAKLNIITGETGAGKSIMLGALGLLMGNRADTKVLWDDQKKCSVEATFDISDYSSRDFFDRNDLDYDQECIIRREITPSGKSRAFINDTPVTLQQLKDLSPSLMDIHSQHDGLQLAAEKYQLFLLDAYAGHSALLQDYANKFEIWRDARKHLEELKNAMSLSAQEEDYKRFILDELISANLDELDIEALEEELSQLENAEEILNKLGESDQILDQSEFSVIAQLESLQSSLSKLSLYGDAYQQLNERLSSCLIELKDLHTELNLHADKVNIDPEKLAEVQERVDLYHRLLTKHQLSDKESLIDLRNQTAASLSMIDHRDEEIKKAELALEQAEKKMLEAGLKLSKSRKQAAHNFQLQVSDTIKQLGIENGVLTIEIESIDPSSSGLDQANYLFSANKGISPRPLKNVASGGEFSRLIFAVKYHIASKASLPTIIFDEIDTGVSGEVAIKMINFMKEMAKHHQIISISHLPQFAAGGDKHFYVFKDHSENKTITKIKVLEENERIHHIAQMIGGNEPTDVALNNARQLLGQH